MKLYYFDIYARAEPIRMLLTHAKKEFEDVRVTKEQADQMKAEGKLEFGQLPVIEHDGKFYAQSAAILRFFGRKNGYYPEDPVLAYRIDSTLDAISDAVTAIVKVAFNPDAEAKKAAGIDLVTNYLPKWLGAIDKRLANNATNKFVVGESFTIADF